MSNTLPTVAIALNDTTATQDQLFTFEIPAGSFTDVDLEDVLTYSVSLEGGEPLPDWLNFDAETNTISGTPSETDLASLNIKVTATDLSGATVDDVFALTVSAPEVPPVDVNNAPTVASELADAIATQDQLFTFEIPAGSFSDADLEDVLTYSVSLEGGEPLPDWLNFDALTNTFSGTPSETDLASLNIKVTATDLSGATVDDVFALTVNPVVVPTPENNAPTVASELADTTATQDQLFSFVIPAGSFTDADLEDVLSYSVSLDGGEPLPTWLTFNAETNTISGTPTAEDLNNLAIRVTATDGTDSISDVFALTVNPAILPPDNNAPTVESELADATATQDQLFSFVIPAGSFADVDLEDVLTYSVSLEGGEPLPSWLTFNAETNTISGTPTADDLNNLAIRVTATDGTDSISDVFSLTVNPVVVPTPENNAPTVAIELLDAVATQDQAFNFVIPAGSFTDADLDDVLTYSASLEDGSLLPTWLTFNAETGTFSGTPTAEDLNNLAIRVTANDGSASVSDVFSLTVNPVVVPPVPEPPAPKPITIQNAIDGIWNINGSGKVKATAIGNNTDRLNEVGVFKLDADNKVNGFAVGDAGFAKAVLESGKVVFSILPDGITKGLDLSRSFQVNDGERLGFFTVSNGTVEGNLSSNNFTNFTTSIDPLNPFRVKESEGAFTLDWNQGNTNLSFNFQVDNTSASPLDSIASQQGNKEGELLDLRAVTGKVEATFTMKREAGFNNSVSFYKIDDAAGTVTSSSGKQFRPGESGYIEAALSNAISGLNLAGKNGETVSVSQMVDAGSLYAPILITNGTTNNLAGANIFTAFSLGNSDRTDHVRLLGDNTFGFEDMVNGGDKDFNDVIVQATFKTV